MQRYREHIAKKHSEEQAQEADTASAAAADQVRAEHLLQAVALTLNRSYEPAVSMSIPAGCSSSPADTQTVCNSLCRYMPVVSAHLLAHAQNLLQDAQTLQPGSKGGYYTEKSPKMLLLEWCTQQKRPKPRYKVIAAAADTLRCKVRLA